MPGGARQPGVGLRHQFGVGPVAVFVGRRRIDDAGDVAGTAQHELVGPAQHPRTGIGGGPRRDVVLDGGNEVGGRLHFRQVDGRPVEGDGARFDQLVADVHLAQVKQVHGHRHARRIRIPVQQVERKRVLAQQVVVDIEGPDQVVGAQHVEGARHLGAFEQAAALFHALLEGIDLRFVHIHAEVARLGEIDQAGEKSRGVDAIVLLRVEVA